MSNKTVAAWAAIAGVLSGFVDSPILAILGGFVLFLGGANLEFAISLLSDKETL